MFQFPGLARSAASGARARRLRRAGCPIRKSGDRRSLAPPPGLSQLATSFLASDSLGIPRAPFFRFLALRSRPYTTPRPRRRTLARTRQGPRSPDRESHCGKTIARPVSRPEGLTFSSYSYLPGAAHATDESAGPHGTSFSLPPSLSKNSSWTLECPRRTSNAPCSPGQT